MTAVVEPQNAEDKTISFSSSDESIATVTPKQGKVTGIKTEMPRLLSQHQMA
ncbi:Ig domain-containing protein [Enterococcus termitis]